MIITIDGPSGTGKSTVAKKLAEVLGMTYFDTGALYRAISWQVLESQISALDEEKMKALLKEFVFRIRIIENKKHYFVGKTDVTEAIRSPEVTAIVSEISALKIVRDALKPIQTNFSKEMDVVFEGRDLGTVVFPHAELKFFVTASPEVRAERRLKDFRARFPEKEFSFNAILKEIQERDHYDSTRKHAPLKQAEDAILIDTSDLTIDEVVAKMQEIYFQRMQK